MSKIYVIAEMAGRIGIALIFLLSGVTKIGDYGATQVTMESVGVPGGLLPLVIFVEIVGSLALMIGWKTRFMALMLAAFTIVTAVYFHTDFSNQMQMAMFLKNISIAGGLVVVFAVGAGSISIDRHKLS